MKRFILVLVLILSVSGLFAEGMSKKDKVYFEKKYQNSFLGFYESSNLEKSNGYKYYIDIYDYMSEEETVSYHVFCNDYEKIKNYFFKVKEGGLNMKEPYFHFYVWSSLNLVEYSQFLPKDKEVVNIKEVYQSKDFVKGSNLIHDFHVCVIE